VNQLSKAAKNSEVLNQERETSMDLAIDTQAEKAKEKDYNTPKGISVGIEVERPLVKPDLSDVPVEIRDQIIDSVENAEIEVGATQAETTVPPLRDLDNLHWLNMAIGFEDEALEQEAIMRGIEALRYGTNPFVDPKNAERSNEEKYEIVPETYEKLRNTEIHDKFGKDETIDPKNSDLAGLICSTQLNIQAESLENAIDLANTGYMISPYIASVSGNSRFIAGTDLGFDDTRMQIWEKSHDDRDSFDEEPGVGRIDSYWDDFDDYIEGAKSRPHILNDEKHEEVALDIAQGMYWKDTRVKVVKDGEISDEVLVEYRMPSTQPTKEEETAVHALYLGRALFSEETGEDLMDIDKVNRNRSAAMHNGLDTKLYSSDGELLEADSVIRHELLKAEEGLRRAGIEDPGYLDILYDRVDERMTPSDKIKQSYDDNLAEGMEEEDAIYSAIVSENEKKVKV